MDNMPRINLDGGDEFPDESNPLRVGFGNGFSHENTMTPLPHNNSPWYNIRIVLCTAIWAAFVAYLMYLVLG